MAAALVGVDIGLAVLGLAVLAVIAWRLWGQVKQLGRGVANAAATLEAARADLDALPRHPVGNRSDA
jgi:hypothetical protein